MPYSLTGEPPSNPDDFRLWVVEQLRRIEEEAINPMIVQTQKLYVAPTKPREGMIVIADGASWNPGAGAGTYVYRSSAWRKMD